MNISNYPSVCPQKKCTEDDIGYVFNNCAPKKYACRNVLGGRGKKSCQEAPDGNFDTIEECKSDGCGILTPSYDYTSFKAIATQLIKEAKSYKQAIPDILVSTPAMANGPILDSINQCVAVMSDMSKSASSVCGYATTDSLQLPAGASEKNLLSKPCGAIWSTDAKDNTRQVCKDKCKFTSPADDYKCNGFPILKKYNRCSSQCGNENGKWRDCRCNGWLDLLKNVDDSYFNNVNIINIHAYHYFAHIVKLRILSTILVFHEEITNGNKIWLTETACIYNSDKVLDLCSQSDPTGIEKNVKFIKDLFWLNTNNSTDCIDSDQKADATKLVKKYNTSMKDYYIKNIGPVMPFRSQSPDILPGLRSNDKFEFLGTTGTWSEHGLGAVTYFTACIPAWNEEGFPEKNSTANLCDSRIFTNDGDTNKIWDALLGN